MTFSAFFDQLCLKSSGAATMVQVPVGETLSNDIRVYYLFYANVVFVEDISLIGMVD